MFPHLAALIAIPQRGCSLTGSRGAKSRLLLEAA
jgi:hypothetical protein